MDTNGHEWTRMEETRITRIEFVLIRAIRAIRVNFF